MGEIDDAEAPSGTLTTHRSPTMSKRARIDGADSGVEAEDPKVSESAQEKLASVMVNQLRLFGTQLSQHVVTMREQDHASRELPRRQTQEQMCQLEAAQMRQAQTLSAAAERVGA